MKAITASEARARLFELIDEVLEKDRVVWIRHRDRESRVALVSEERLERLETLARIHRGRRPFKLAGSMRIPAGEDVERILADLRREDAEAFEARLREFTDGPEEA